MALTLRDLVYDLFNLAKIKNDDTTLTKTHLAHIIKTWSARFITQNYRKARLSDVNLTQDLGCVAMEVVDSAEWCDIEIGCTILKSVLQLPTAIETDDKPLFTFIGSIQKTGPQYQLIPWARFSWIKHQKYTSKLPYVSLKDGYIYMLIGQPKTKAIDKINIQGIFEDPTEASRFNHCDGQSCYTPESRYPIDAAMVPLLREMILTKELAVYQKNTEDKDNDNNDKV